MMHIATWELERLLEKSHAGSLASVRDFAPGEVIFRSGDRADYLAVVLSGSVELRRRGRKLSLVDAGAIFGEMGLIDGLPRNADAVALTNCRIAIVSDSQFHSLLDESPRIAMSIMRTLTERIRPPAG